MVKNMIKKLKKSKGFTLMETVIAVALMGFAGLIAISAMNLTAKGYVGTNLQIGTVSEDANFAYTLSETIRESTVTFAIPGSSFIKDKLDSGWDYLGLMENVHIPATVSRTGKEIDSTRAMVYIEYIGDQMPAVVPSDCNLLTVDGYYFLQKILGHEFTEESGIKHEYSLEFTSTDPANIAAQTLGYNFESRLIDADGNQIGTEPGVDIGTILNALNAVQVVYKSSSGSPCTAIAFRKDFLPTYSVQDIKTNKPTATIVMVLDVSGSMRGSLNGTTRMEALKDRVIWFCDEFAANDQINIIIVPFSTYVGYNSYCPVDKMVFNAQTDHDALVNRVSQWYQSGDTNAGDGIRIAYYEVEKLKNSGVNTGNIFMILMTDGEVNTYTYKGSTSNYYMESGLKSSAGVSTRCSTTPSREYARMWGERFVNAYSSTNYLISICSGMSNADKATFEGVFSTEAIDVNSLTEFTEAFSMINQNINEIMWAFEGPRL